MATCPYCKGHLTDGHRCPRRRYLAAVEIGAALLGGGFAGLLLLAAFDLNNQVTDRWADPLAFIFGAAVAVAIVRLVRT